MHGTTRSIAPAGGVIFIVRGLIPGMSNSEEWAIISHHDGNLPEVQPAGLGIVPFLGRGCNRRHAGPELRWQRWQNQRRDNRTCDHGPSLAVGPPKRKSSDRA